MIAAIIQARMGSSRLPGKTLMTINGEPLLGHLVKRVREVRHINEIIIATTTEERDDAIVEFARGNNLKFYRGSEEDVLDRFYRAAVENSVEAIVRVTPDCPMLDPKVSEAVISKYIEGDYDYVSNARPPTYPDGLDTEVFSFQVLEKTWKEASLPSEREHVVAYMINHPEVFRLCNVEKDGENLSWMRLTVDTLRDFELATEIFANFPDSAHIFYLDDILALLKQKPELLEINKGISRNEGYQSSLRKDPKSISTD